MNDKPMVITSPRKFYMTMAVLCLSIAAMGMIGIYKDYILMALSLVCTWIVANNMRIKYIVSKRNIIVRIGNRVIKSVDISNGRFMVVENGSSMVGVLLGYGTVSVITDGGVTTCISRVDNPWKVIIALQLLKNASTGR